MNIYEFIDQDELDALPEENDLAFLQFFEITSQNLKRKIKDLPQNSSNFDKRVLEIRYRYVNFILTAAKEYEFKPFSDAELPEFSAFDSVFFNNFTSEMGKVTGALILRRSARSKRNSVLITHDKKVRIRGNVEKIRDEIEKSHLEEAKKKRLFEKLDEFETELDKKRVDIAKAAIAIFEIMALPGAIWSSGEVMKMLYDDTLKIIAESKIKDSPPLLEDGSKAILLLEDKSEGS